MENITVRKKEKKLQSAILSLSLLTVMAGAAVAPALDVIRTRFSESPALAIQLVISMPALFIFLTSFIFPRLIQKIRARTLIMAGLILYVGGGVSAGYFNGIAAVLAARALVGIGVGIIMPLSTGLLSFYFSKDKQDLLMGYSSAMNQMGAAVATLISGFLASMNWRASFLVYLLGLISIILCAIWMPNDKIAGEKAKKGKDSGHTHSQLSVFRENFLYIITMFFLMITFFIYPSDFAMETVKDGIISSGFIAPIMASMDIVAFFGGLAFVHLKKGLGKNIRFAAPCMYFAGYVLLAFFRIPALTLIGSWLVGFANGLGIPFIIASASRKMGKAAASTVMPMLSAALYIGQFVTPFILAAVRGIFGSASHLSWFTAVVTSVILLILSPFINEKD